VLAVTGTGPLYDDTYTGPRWKRCTRCGQDRPFDQFSRDRRRRDGRFQWCKPCASERARERRTKLGRDVFRAKEQLRYPERNARRSARRRSDPIVYRSESLRRLHNMSWAEYESMLLRQGGVCAICCGHKPEKRQRHLQVDHDHSTGRVRALLCGRCNKGLGCFNDDPELLACAIDYLRSHSHAA
jgi:hypothetical protein